MKLADDLLARADRIQRSWKPLAFAFAVQKKFGDDRAGDLAALIAYYAFLAIFPLLLVLVTVLNIVLKHDRALRERVVNSALSAYPEIGKQLAASVSGLHSTGLALIVGLVAALLGARGVALAAQNALNSVWAVPQDRRPAFPWSMLRGLAMIVVMGLGQTLTVLLSGAVGGVAHVISGALAEAGTVTVALVLNIGLFWLTFKLATASEVSWRDLRLGAIISAVSWQILLLLGGFIVGHALRRSSALYGVFGVVLGLLAWLYLQAQVTLYAVEVCTVRSWRLWPRALRPPPTDQDKLAVDRHARAERRLPGP